MDHNLQLSGTKLKVQEDHPHSLIQINITKIFDFKNHLIECNQEKDYICAHEQTGVSKHWDSVSRHVLWTVSRREKHVKHLLKRLEIEPEIREIIAQQILDFVEDFLLSEGCRVNDNVGIKVVGDLEIRYNESEQADVGTVEPIQCNDVSEGKDKEKKLKDKILGKLCFGISHTRVN